MTAPTSPVRGARWWMIIGSVLTVAAIVMGGFQILELVARDQHEQVTSFDGPVDVVEVDAHHGSVRVVSTPGDRVVVTERINSGLRAPRRSLQMIDGPVIDGGLDSEPDGRRVVASSSCPVLAGMWCSVSYVIEVPVGTDLTLRSRHGDVEVRGEVGAVAVSTRHGDVEVSGSAGDVDAVTQQGDVVVDGAHGRIEATTRHGDLRLVAAAPPGLVRGETRHGDVLVVLPESEATYRVEASARNGTTDAPVRSDPASDRLIAVSTRHGDIEVRY